MSLFVHRSRSGIEGTLLSLIRRRMLYQMWVTGRLGVMIRSDKPFQVICTMCYMNKPVPCEPRKLFFRGSSSHRLPNPWCFMGSSARSWTHPWYLVAFSTVNWVVGQYESRFWRISGSYVTSMTCSLFRLKASCSDCRITLFFSAEVAECCVQRSSS